MHYDDIATVSQWIRSQRVSPVQVMEHCLARIESLAPGLNAFITIAPDAREQAASAAEEIRAGRWRGPLHGVPVAVKDFFDTAGIRTTAGAEQFAGRIPSADAQVVEKLRSAGAIIVGKTNMDAMGMATTGLTSNFGPVKNPWNAMHVPGGSSAGSACAVAAGLCYATVDTDAVGSVRLPAACCGVVGFKGSPGLISLQGVLGDGPVDDFIRWMAHGGVTARSALDAALVLDALVEPLDAGLAAGLVDAQRTMGSVRVGVVRSAKPEDRLGEAFDRAVRLLAGSGHGVRDTSLPSSDAEDGSMADIERDRAAVSAAFDEIDVMVLPTLGGLVPTVAAAAGDLKQAVSAENTAFANYFGLPAISVPCGFDANGLPIGLQIVGRPGGDQAVLLLAHRFARIAGFADKHPVA
jgi:aspartyl-tRNA(Asn)/glutamyl-tRNA(Gln) amidotransferase subunit A